MRPLYALALALGAATSAAAQDHKPHRIEIDGIVGYTAVNVEEWAQFPRIDELSHMAGGAVLRGLLVYLGPTHVGLEIGTQQLFSYKYQQDTQGQLTTTEATIAGFHILIVGRFVELPRYSWDLGFGWYGLGDATVPGLMTNLNYAVMRRPRFSIPVGARLNVVFNEPAIAATMMAKIGISIPLSREPSAPAR
ncbi:MAG: hypothetical protein ACREOK_10645 [Gemmatimonadaceae bacterium]